jgi:hypothetical protein
MLCAVAIEFTEDVGEGTTGAGHERGVHVEHTGVFSSLFEILFDNRLDASRSKSDSIEHADKIAPEGEEGGAEDVLTSA